MQTYLHMAQLMPLPLIVSCFSKIQIDFTCLVPAHPGSPGQRAVKRVCVCVCVCVRVFRSLFAGGRSPRRREQAAGSLEFLAGPPLVPASPQCPGDVRRRHAVGVVRDQAQQEDSVHPQVLRHELGHRSARSDMSIFKVKR